MMLVRLLISLLEYHRLNSKKVLDNLRY
jgi:hypothetical protein